MKPKPARWIRGRRISRRRGKRNKKDKPTLDHLFKKKDNSETTGE